MSYHGQHAPASTGMLQKVVGEKREKEKRRSREEKEEEENGTGNPVKKQFVQRVYIYTVKEKIILANYLVTIVVLIQRIRCL